MYAQTSEKVLQPSAAGRNTTVSRAVLRTRPRIQRALIRSWEYRRPFRVTVLAIRMLVVMWLFVLTAVLVPAGYAWGLALLPTALAVLALSLWVFTTAAKGWPAVDA